MAPHESFAQFLKRREAASNEYIRGHVEPLLAMSSSRDDATFMPPSGEHMKGAAKVNAANRRGAKAFGEKSTGRFEILASGSDGALGFWTGIQHASMEIAGKPGKLAMKLRVTEVFRVERGAWKLVHRHADMPPPKQKR